jgi:hypothetical protein
LDVSSGSGLYDARNYWFSFLKAISKTAKKFDGSDTAAATAAQLQSALAWAERDGAAKFEAAAGEGGSKEFLHRLVFGHIVRAIGADLQKLVALGARPPNDDVQRVLLLLEQAVEVLRHGLEYRGYRSMTGIQLRVDLLSIQLLLREADGFDDADISGVAVHNLHLRNLANFVVENLAAGWEDEAAFVNIFQENPPWEAKKGSTSLALAAAYKETWDAFYKAHYQALRAASVGAEQTELRDRMKPVVLNYGNAVKALGPAAKVRALRG